MCVCVYTVLIILRLNEARHVVEAFEIKAAHLLLKPETGEFVAPIYVCMCLCVCVRVCVCVFAYYLPGATCQLLLIVPITNAGPR